MKKITGTALKFKFFFILLLLGCRTGDALYLDGKNHQVYAPPNMVQVSENFYADETEISNIDYKEYLFSLTEIYGSSSPEYWDAVPDTTVFRHEFIQYGAPYIENYFRHPAYDDCPVVGIDLEQAKKYTAWRTEIVVENLLFQKGLIKKIEKVDLTNRFTIQRYQKEEHDWIIRKEVIAIPVFKIPTVMEWEKMAGVDTKFKYGIDSLSRDNRKILKKYKHLSNTKDNTDSYQFTPNPIRSYGKNVYGIYGVIGNVAELVDEEKVVKGGSWRHTLNDTILTGNLVFEKPNFWVGFRNVCQYEALKFKK